MIRNVEFKNVKNDFLNNINKDILDINKSTQMFVFADKTRNIYETSKDSYLKLLSDNVTNSYKKADDSPLNKVNIEAKIMATKLGIAGRASCMAKKAAFITLKDHKDNFENSPKCRLLNPAKPELGKVSKIITEKLIAGIKDSVSLNQWKNTKDVITWFNNIENKSCYSFVQFDIVDFYPSISEELFNKSVDYAKNFSNISDDEMRLLRHCKKSFLFDQNSTLVKKPDHKILMLQWAATMGQKHVN